MARCATALVLWRIVQSVGDTPGVARCLNDGFSIPLADHADATLVSALQAMATHTVQLGGAIGQVTDIVELS